MVYQVGSPAMFDGNRFLPETGTPIWKMLRSRTVLELCEPEPLTVATWMLMSLAMRRCPSWPDDSWGTTSVVAIPCTFLVVTGQRSPQRIEIGCAADPEPHCPGVSRRNAELFSIARTAGEES